MRKTQSLKCGLCASRPARRKHSRQSFQKVLPRTQDPKLTNIHVSRDACVLLPGQ
jgi:hypothetical protein